VAGSISRIAARRSSFSRPFSPTLLFAPPGGFGGAAAKRGLVPLPATDHQQSAGTCRAGQGWNRDAGHFLSLRAARAKAAVALLLALPVGQRTSSSGSQ
jgi:hypothetical protein